LQKQKRHFLNAKNGSDLIGILNVDFFKF